MREVIENNKGERGTIFLYFLKTEVHVLCIIQVPSTIFLAPVVIFLSTTSTISLLSIYYVTWVRLKFNPIED